MKCTCTYSSTLFIYSTPDCSPYGVIKGEPINNGGKSTSEFNS